MLINSSIFGLAVGRWVAHRLGLTVFLVLIFFNVAQAQLAWPTVSSTTRPWVRWWWEGSAVTPAGLDSCLQQYRRAGIGGVEITPIYGVKGYEKQSITFLSPAWMDMLVHTLKVSKRLGLGVDLANATGWPFGGPWVKDADASKTIYYKTYSLSRGERLQTAIEYFRPGWARNAAGRALDPDSIQQPFSNNLNMQSLAIDQVQYPGNLPVRALVAYSPGKIPVDIRSSIDATGHLNWVAPEGQWTLYALFEGLHGKMVERAAPGGEGYAIDHFSARAARNYFKRFDQAFQGYDLSYLRGFFNDSYEVDDAREQANWTPDFPQQFQKRRGYDLLQQLPALFGQGDSMANSRVIFDYRSTIDELILENFTQEWKRWGGARKKLLRNQSHGSPANTLDLYSVVDIPETEGNDILRFKFATSAAHVSGKKLVSAEAATWLDEHFLSSWGEVRKAVDLYFLGGVNHIVYHGTAYSPPGVPWPGWLFYAAVHFQPVNPMWKDFQALNEYVTRSQSLLQNSQPDNEILLYYPLADRYSDPGKYLLQHFDGMERNFEHSDFEYLSSWMLEKGYGFDFFSDRQSKQFSASTNGINSGGSRYKVILLPANRLIPLATIKKLLSLARQGATLVFYKDLPSGLPGVHSDADDLIFHELLNGLFFSKSGGVKQARIGAGRVLIGNDPAVLLSSAGLRSEPAVGQGLSLLRKKNKSGKLFFLNNRTERDFEGWVNLSGEAVAFGLFDPLTGSTGLARSRMDGGDRQVWLQIPAWGSVFVQSYSHRPAAAAYPYLQMKGKEIAIEGKWKLDFLQGGPELPPGIELPQPKFWNETEGEAVKSFSGTAAYSIEFPAPAVKADRWLLDLGKVKETVEVVLNGKTVATLIGPMYRCVISSKQMASLNRLELRISNLMANRIAYMDREQLPWKIFYNINMPARKRENSKDGVFDASGWKPVSSGLAGPVTLTALE